VRSLHAVLELATSDLSRVNCAPLVCRDETPGRRKCGLVPIRPWPCGVNNPNMQIAIRCHPYAPVASDELEDWLGREVERIRAAAPDATVRLMRLSQALSAGRVAVGWLIELDGLRGEIALTDMQLDAVLRDMRLLGLQPTLLASNGASGLGAGEPRIPLRADPDNRVAPTISTKVAADRMSV
jgi:hypothetical protein